MVAVQLALLQICWKDDILALKEKRNLLILVKLDARKLKMIERLQLIA